MVLVDTLRHMDVNNVYRVNMFTISSLKPITEANYVLYIRMLSGVRAEAYLNTLDQIIFDICDATFPRIPSRESLKMYH